ncbi:MAG: TetR family transcriptional regulator, partial [Oscillospiraceae bacterium]
YKRRGGVLLSNAEFTKLMIAGGLKRLLETTPFAEVAVGDIAKHCKISRNTFYYHFKDKYDIISWVFYTEITPIIGEDVDIAHWRDGLLALCRYMQANLYLH